MSIKCIFFSPLSILTAWHSAFVKESHLASCWRLHHYYSNQCTVDLPDNDSTAWTNASDLHLQKNQNIWKWHTFLKNASLNVLVLSFAVPAEVLCRSTWSWSDTGLQHWGVGGTSSAYAEAKPLSRLARDSTEISNSSSLHFLNDYVWETHTPKPSASTAAEIVPAKDEWLGAFSPHF